MSRIIQWPPVPGEAPPQKQYDVGVFQGWPCCCSHLEPNEQGGHNPHFVVDWTKKVNPNIPYPFSPSAVPQFLVDVWMKNAKENRPHVKKSIAELHHKHWGLPVYVVGTGPSLYKNMDQLRKVKDGIIIATNNAINILPEDIKIDYYCVVDGRLPARWWDNLPESRKDVKVISVPLVTTQLAKTFGDENIYWMRFAGKEGPNKCFEDYGDLDDCCLEPGYVVGFTATNLAFWLGGNTIVMVGMDCCLTNGYLHAGDSAKAHAIQGEEYTAVVDMYGTPQVSSSTYMRGMWKLQAAAKLNAQHSWFINATEGGCLTKFFDVIPLHEVVGWESNGTNGYDGTGRARQNPAKAVCCGDGQHDHAFEASCSLLKVS